MPLYEFECVACHRVFEELVRMGSRGEELNCPGCGGGEVRKLMSTFYGRASGEGGAHHSIAGSGCECGNDCSNCTSCSCKH